MLAATALHMRCSAIMLGAIIIELIMRWSFLIVTVLTVSLFAEDPSPYAIATLVQQADDGTLTAPLTAGLQSKVPLVRATAARVIAIRGLTPLLPLVREAVAGESDASAAREEIRALVLLGGAEDLALAVQTSAKWPRGMDDAVAVAVARLGLMPAVDAYVSTLRKTRMANHGQFFRVALWGHPDLLPLAASRVLGLGDERGWSGVLGTAANAETAMPDGVMAASLGAASEEIRSESVWYLVRAYGLDPSSMHAVVKEKLAARGEELSSDREDFGRELLRRMVGGAVNDDPRWLKFLESKEADGLLPGQHPALQYLTDAEYAVRYNRCEVQTTDCALPKTRSGRTIPSQPVGLSAINLPEVLPAGLADAIMTEGRCRDRWLGVADASVDRAGRISTLDLHEVSGGAACRRALDTLLRLSLATNTSIRSGFNGPVLLAGSAKNGLCLDEDEPEADDSARPSYLAGAVQSPQVIKRVNPQFPDSARRAMGHGYQVMIVVGSEISKTGCVRNLHLVTQTPFPEVNGAAVEAMSQWKFRPAYLAGKPTTALFNITMNFKMK